MRRWLITWLILLAPAISTASWPFDATDTVTVTDADVLTFPSTDWTLCGWIKSAGASTEWRTFFYAGPDTGQHHIFLAVKPTVNGGVIWFDWRGSHSTSEVNLNGTTNVGSSTAWTHLAFIRSSNVIRMYINGTLEATSGDVTFHYSCNPTTDWVWGSSVFNSRLAEWSKYNRAISVGEASELAGLVAGGRPEDVSGTDPVWLLDMYDGVDCQIGGLSLTNSGVAADSATHPVTRASAIFATSPSPADEATGQNRTVIVSWTDDAAATGNKVYGGTNPASLSLLRGTDTQEWYVASGLSPGVYYWRVDEIDAESNVTPGVTWMFTVVGKVGARQ